MTQAIVIGATHSGCGKTCFSVGLARALVQRGLRVQCFKVGPDYLDPTWLQDASGRPCFNLDTWMQGDALVSSLYETQAREADFCIIEGVMGLYDGAQGHSDVGSTAALARLLKAPVLLLANASGCARSFAAMVEGFSSFAGHPDFVGVVANRTGKRRHADILEEALLSMRQPLSWLGAVPKGAFPELHSRHLGLSASKRDHLSMTQIDQCAQAVEQLIAVDRLLQKTPAVSWEASLPSVSSAFSLPPVRCRLGLARDDAFSFYYPCLENALREHGAEVEWFSPVNDQQLPSDIQGVILGGGYPELYAQTLTQNYSMLDSIRSFALQGGVIYAECGGLMYLSEGIQLAESFYPMLGILPQKVMMTDRLQKLGYVQVTLQKDGLLGKTGDQLRGHEFHYSCLADSVSGWQELYQCHNSQGTSIGLEGYAHGNILASYVHIPLEAFPQAISNLISFCEKI